MVDLRIRRIFASSLLTMISVLSASPALAEVCDKVRPDWNGTPISTLSETITLFASPLSLLLLIATAFAVRFRSQWGALVVVLGWTGVVSLVSMIDPDGTRELARIEGCIGSPALFIALVAAICGAMIIYTMPRETRL